MGHGDEKINIFGLKHAPCPMPDAVTDRIKLLRYKTITAERYLSIEQARIITRVYRENEGLPVPVKRALALAASLNEINISIDPEEIIVGNRTSDIRAGVVFPEAGISWLLEEIETLPYRQQDPFKVKEEDKIAFIDEIAPYWKGKTLEDDILKQYGDELIAIEKVIKINQKDHAQGHICPNVRDWLNFGPKGLIEKARKKLLSAGNDKKVFYESVIIALEGARKFMKRYARMAARMLRDHDDLKIRENLMMISGICNYLTERPPEGFREAAQSVWFLFVILQMESNASSFSPGRMDQYLHPYFSSYIRSGKSYSEIQEIIDSLFIKFNQIIYMRNSHSARYFAGFPTGFNITLGGQNEYGEDATNKLSYMFLKAQEHVRLPQPNLTARLHDGSPDSFISECSRIIGLGTGMPQIVNDNSIIPALENAGIVSLPF